MNFKKIFDSEILQVYSIKNPSVNMKKMFPKKFIVGINAMGMTHSVNVNTLPSILAYGIATGYIFTYESTFPNNIIRSPKKSSFINKMGSTLPVCLDQYFNESYSNKDEKVDIILSCNSKNAIMPINFTQEILIRSNSTKLFGYDTKEELLKNKVDKNKISKIIMKTINDNIERVDSLENWVQEVIINVPLNCEGFTIKYPNVINSKNLRKSKISKNKLFIGYDFRPRIDDESIDIYDYENIIITSIEDIFEKPSMKLHIKDNYNGLLSRIKEELDKNKLKYLDYKDEIIVTLANLRKLDLTYNLTDFL